MTIPDTDPYVVLALPREATSAEIKQAYFALVRTYPPEREPEMFKRIRAAYERLRDPVRRLETDMLLPVRWPEPERKRRVPRMDLTVHREDVLAVARSLSDLERRDWREHFGKIQL